VISALSTERAYESQAHDPIGALLLEDRTERMVGRVMLWGFAGREEAERCITDERSVSSAASGAARSSG
jgi:hypothetical protein